MSYSDSEQNIPHILACLGVYTSAESKLTLHITLLSLCCGESPQLCIASSGTGEASVSRLTFPVLTDRPPRLARPKKIGIIVQSGSPLPNCQSDLEHHRNTATRTIMSVPFSSPFGANANPFGNDRSQGGSSNVMHSVVEEEENGNGNGPAQAAPESSFPGTFGGDASTDTPPTVRSPPNPDSYPAQYNFARRTSVSAESLKPSADRNDNWSPPVHDKTPEQLDRLKKAIEGNFLFSHLDDEQSEQILGALVEKPIPAKGIKVS